jgi:hypothetical protein
MPAPLVMEVIKTMTGQATLWLTEHGDYIGLQPVTNMKGVEIDFYSLNLNAYGKTTLTQEDYDKISDTLRRSRRWTLRTVDNRDK